MKEVCYGVMVERLQLSTTGGGGGGGGGRRRGPSSKPHGGKVRQTSKIGHMGQAWVLHVVGLTLCSSGFTTSLLCWRSSIQKITIVYT